jgi:transcription factor STE12
MASSFASDPSPSDIDYYHYQSPFPHRRSLLPPARSSSYLQVSTSTSHEHDPNERTARPGNAHHHTEFHEALGAAADDSAVKSEFLTNGDNHPDNNHIPPNDYTSSTPGLTGGLSRPLKPIERERLAHLDRLKFFLATAPSRWDDAAENAAPTPLLSSMGENVDDLLDGRVTTPTPPSQQFMSGTAPYGPGSFGSPYQYDSSSGPSTSTANSTYRNTFASFPTPQGIPDPIHQQLSHLRAPHHPALNRFLLPNHEYVTCVLWNGLYHISGTDIVRALVFRFEVRSFIGQQC